jgi:hypothetical protein
MSNFEELTAIAQNVCRLSDKGYTQSDLYQLILTLGKLSGILRTLNINSNHNILANDIVIMINKGPTFEQLLYYVAILIEILQSYYIGNTKGDSIDNGNDNGNDSGSDNGIKVRFKRYRKKKNKSSSVGSLKTESVIDTNINNDSINNKEDNKDNEKSEYKEEKKDKEEINEK